MNALLTVVGVIAVWVLSVIFLFSLHWTLGFIWLILTALGFLGLKNN